MTNEKIGTRRQYRPEFKAQIVADCDAPGTSVAKVAMAHGINANIVHGWRKLARVASSAVIAKSQEFIPVQVAPVVPDAAARDIEVELHRGTLTMRIRWPLSTAADFATWTRELLR